MVINLRYPNENTEKNANSGKTERLFRTNGALSTFETVQVWISPRRAVPGEKGGAHRDRGEGGKVLPPESGLTGPNQPGDEITPACYGRSFPTGRNVFCR